MYGVRTQPYRALMSTSRARKSAVPPNRIKEFRELAKLSQERLAEMLGTTHPTVQRIENGKQALTDAWLYKFAKALKRRPAELLRVSASEATSCKVIGDVAAGVFKEALEWDEDQQYDVGLYRDDRFPGAPRFALEVRGNSMNRLYPPGSIVVCVKFGDIGRDAKPGERVVVQRYAHDEVEATLKELVQDEHGRKWLWPRSTDPEFQQPWRVPDRKEDPGDERLEIWALVIWSSKRE